MELISPRHIYCICPDTQTPLGGVRKIYNQVDILRDLGYNAFVLHAVLGFRCNWFQANTRIAYLVKTEDPIQTMDANGEISFLPPFGEGDILVIPDIHVEVVVPRLAEWNVRGVIFNQSPYLTFPSFPSLPITPYSASVDEDLQPLYLSERVLGTIVISKYSKQFLKSTYSNLAVYHVHCSINKKLFQYRLDKKKQIAYMPSKNPEASKNIITIIRERKRLKDWTFYPIENVPESQVAEIMKESALFLNFSYLEGFGLPPAEAMACGCVVIGYHGNGGREFFKRPYAHPIEAGDIVHFALTVEKIALEYDQHKAEGKLASDYILKQYSQEREREDFKLAWKALLT